MSPEPPREEVFVYGTLRRGASNAHRLARGQWLAEGVVCGRLYRVSWYPGLRLDPAAGPVRGELHVVDAALMEELDAFEGVVAEGGGPGEYRRVRCRVELADGSSRPAWVWEFLPEVDESRRIASGDWLAAEAGEGGA